MEVPGELGPGFIESIYRKVLLHELQLRDVSTSTEVEVQVSYKDLTGGRYRLDIFANGQVVVELKAGV